MDRERSSRGSSAADGDVFRDVADAIPALLAVMSPDGEVKTVNRHALEYFGKTERELRDWRTSDSVHPEDLPGVLAAWSRAVETGTPYDVEHRLRGADGRYRWFHARALPMKDGAGRIAGWCCLQTDIDERKRVALISEGEKKVLEMVAAGKPLSAVLEALCGLCDAVADGCTSGVLLLDRSNTRVRLAVAPALPASYNRALEGQTVSIAQGPCGMAASLKKQVIVTDVTTETRWHSDAWPALALSHGLSSCWSSPVLSVSGDSLGTFAIYQRTPGTPTPFHQELIQQLTHLASIAIERARTEEALHRNQAVLAEAELLSATGSFLLDPVSGAHWWSPQMYRIFGFEPGVVPPFDVIRQRVHDDDREAFDRGLSHALRGEGFSADLRLCLPDASVKYLQVEAHAVSLDGGPTESVGAVRDGTERRTSEQALAKARAELAHVSRVTTLGVLTASIAHELNQPLSGIVTNASTCLRILDAAAPDLARARETTRRTIRDASRASDVVLRLRALFGNKTPTTEVFDLNEATREVLALLRSELQLGRIVLQTELAPGALTLTGDRVQLQQVILNLLLNATAAMALVDDRPRLLCVRTETREGHARLSVRDVGVGLGPGPAERLFEAFYTTKEGGMGIGLSVSRAIIEGHRGSLEATRNVGPGATFSFCIPAH